MTRASHLVAALLAACSQGEAIPTPTDTDRAQERAEMVRTQLAARDIRDARVLRAMEAVLRHELVPSGMRADAYTDQPLPIGHNQTISQPYIVALMSQLAGISEIEQPRVLEVGTGSGYQSAVLAEMGAEVWSIEIVAALGERAQLDLRRLGYNVRVRIGDGYAGWPEHAPFDAILVTAAPPRLPEPLIEQLRVGGRMVIPVGDRHQMLRVITKTEDSYLVQDVAPVRFVPMTGRIQSD